MYQPTFRCSSPLCFLGFCLSPLSRWLEPGIVRLSLIRTTPSPRAMSWPVPNCTLYSPADVDSFVFNGVNAQTFHLAVAINGAAPTNICLALYDPAFVKVFSACSSIGYPNYQYSVVIDQKLTATGTYTMVVTEASTSATLNYGVSLERLYPFPPNAQQLHSGQQAPVTSPSDRHRCLHF